MRKTLCCLPAVLAALLTPAAALAQLSVEKATASLLADLEALYHAGSGKFLNQPGVDPEEWGAQYAPAWRDLACLEGLDLGEYPRLAELCAGLSPEDAFVTFVTATWRPLGSFQMWGVWVGEEIQAQGGATDGKQLAQALIVSAQRQEESRQRQGAAPLSFPIGRGPDPTGRHSLHVVYALAVVHQRYPELRPSIRLRRILDFWVRDVTQHPDPVRHAENATTAIEASPYARLCGIAALDRGYELFGDQRYAEARDAEFKRMRQLLDDDGVLRAIREKTSWRHADGWAFTSYQRPLTEAVAAYGQACALLGDEQEVKQAQDWIYAALTRRGGADGPVLNYGGSSFADCCGMIAVLRGEAAMLKPPSVLQKPPE